MNSQLSRHFKTLTQSTDALIKEVSSLSSATYYISPGEGKWSISQILTHLLTSERLSLNYMKKKSQAPVNELGNTGLKENIWFSMFSLSQLLPIRYKAPKALVENTPSPLPFGELVRQWNAFRLELNEFLDSLGPEKVRKKIYRHPVAGRLNAIHAVRFMDLHIKHHYPQVKAIISQQRKKVLQ